jgi:hypothetical protein
VDFLPGGSKSWPTWLRWGWSRSVNSKPARTSRAGPLFRLSAAPLKTPASNSSRRTEADRASDSASQVTRSNERLRLPSIQDGGRRRLNRWVRLMREYGASGAKNEFICSPGTGREITITRTGRKSRAPGTRPARWATAAKPMPLFSTCANAPNSKNSVALARLTGRHCMYLPIGMSGKPIGTKIAHELVLDNSPLAWLYSDENGTTAVVSPGDRSLLAAA